MRDVLVIQPEANAGLSMMADQFAGARVVRPYLGEALPPVSSMVSRSAGLVVLGGSMGAWDDEVAPWLPAVRRMPAATVDARLPTLGICLGAQLLAAACGGTVERGSAGLELGVVPVTAMPAATADPYLGRVLRALDEHPSPAGPRPGACWQVHHYHYDAVIDLPLDAELLITGKVYPHQGFRVGPAAWGVQYHPEVSTELFAEWVGNGVRSGELDPDSTAVLAQARAAAGEQARTAEVHARAFLDVVRARTADRGGDEAL